MSHSSAAGGSSVTISSENSQYLSLTELDDHGKIPGLLLYTMVHFFGDIRKLFSGITDPRDPRKIVYPVGELAFASILMFICRPGPRRQIGFQLRGGQDKGSMADHALTGGNASADNAMAFPDRVLP